MIHTPDSRESFQFEARMKPCLLVKLISPPDKVIDSLPASAKSDDLTIEYVAQVFIVVVGEVSCSEGAGTEGVNR